MGGLTVLRALERAMPDESFVYLGDTARLPYGSKSPATVVRYAEQAAGEASRERVADMLRMAAATHEFQRA